MQGGYYHEIRHNTKNSPYRGAKRAWVALETAAFWILPKGRIPWLADICTVNWIAPALSLPGKENGHGALHASAPHFE